MAMAQARGTKGVRGEYGVRRGILGEDRSISKAVANLWVRRGPYSMPPVAGIPPVAESQTESQTGEPPVAGLPPVAGI